MKKHNFIYQPSNIRWLVFFYPFLGRKEEKYGVTINSKNHSIDLSYYGFYRLRKKVAELTKLDIYEHYKMLNDGSYALIKIKGNEDFFAWYDRKIEELDKKYDGKYSEVLDFLYTSDCDGEADADHCKSVYEIIKDYDDDICYGYCGRSDCAMFKDFKQLIKDGADTEMGIEWY